MFFHGCDIIVDSKLIFFTHSKFLFKHGGGGGDKTHSTLSQATPSCYVKKIRQGIIINKIGKP